MAKRTIKSTMRRWLNNGHLFPHDAVGIVVDGTAAWVVDVTDGYGLQLFASKTKAKDAVDKAAFALINEK